MSNPIRKRIGWSLNATIAVCIATLFALAKYFRYFTQAGDGASYVGLVSSVRTHLKLDPYLYASILNMNENAWSGAGYWCSRDFSFSVRSSESVIQWHAYLLAYPLGFLSWLTRISPAMTTAIAESVSVVFALIICARELRRNNGGRIYTWLILCILITSPILSVGTSGQLQPERLLILPVVVVLTQLDRYLKSGTAHKGIILTAYFFGSLISERSAMTLFWLTFAYILLRSPRKLFRPFPNVFVLMGIFSFCWWVIWTTKFQESIYYKQVNFGSIISGLRYSFTEDSSNTLKMLLVLVPLLVLSLFRWQGLVVGLIALIPNLAISVGGAEKTGLSTHYHSIYFAVFFGTATLGAVELIKRLQNFKWNHRLSPYAFLSILSMMVLFNFSYTSSGYPSPKMINANIGNTVNAYGLNMYTKMDGLKASRIEMIRFVQGIPIGNRISSPEWTMPALIDQGHSLVSYYPLGVKNASVIFAEIDGSSQISYLPWIMDHDTASEVGKCISTAISKRNKNYESRLLRPDLMRIEFLTEK
jgi:hypothetical protein